MDYLVRKKIKHASSFIDEAFKLETTVSTCNTLDIHSAFGEPVRIYDTLKIWNCYETNLPYERATLPLAL
jgi:hypothetical protein